MKDRDRQSVPICGPLGLSWGNRLENPPDFKSDAVRKGYEYWASKRPEGGPPSRADIEPTEMPALLPHVILLDVKPEPRDYRYRLIGTLITKHLSRDWTGTWMSEIEHQRKPSTIWTNCDRVIDTRMPFHAHTPYVGPHQNFLAAEDVILPLRADDGTINMLLVFADYIPKHTLS